MKKMMLVVNPHAGRQQAKGFLIELISLFYQSGWEVTVFPTQNKAQVIETVAQHACAYELLSCVGGDGTLNEVISGLMKCPAGYRPPLGYIPSGTTNDLAASLGIPRDALEAGRAILNGTPLWVDVGGFNDRCFGYVAAFGAFTEVSYQTPQPLKNSLGYFAYLLEGMRHLTELQPHRLRIRADGQELEDSYVFGAVSNSTSIAGMFKLREEEVGLSDGVFEVMLIRTPQSAMHLQHIFTGLLTQNYDPQDVRFFHTARLTVESPDGLLAWALDGEDGGLHRRVEITNLHRSIRFLISGREAPNEERELPDEG